MSNRNHTGVIHPGTPPSVVRLGRLVLALRTLWESNRADGLTWLRLRVVTDAYNREVAATMTAHPAGKGRSHD